MGPHPRLPRARHDDSHDHALPREADSLCDRVAIIDGGAIQALGSPAELEAAHGHDALELDAGDRVDEVQRIVAETVSGACELAGGRVRISTDDLVATARALLVECERRGVPLRGLETRQPSLDAVVLSVTGRVMPGG